MIPLDLRMHRAGVDGFVRGPMCRIDLQCHAALRTCSRLVAFDSRTHWAKILCCSRGSYWRRGGIVFAMAAAMSGRGLLSLFVVVAGTAVMGRSNCLVFHSLTFKSLSGNDDFSVTA
jgi:hypothetical protein